MNRQSPKAHRPGARLTAAGVILVATLLAGCTSTAPTLQAETAGQLQAAVLSVSTAAASGDFAGAKDALESLKAVLATATEEDRLSAGRASDIQAAIALVEADLVALLTPQTPSPSTPPAAPPPETDEPVAPPPEPELPDPPPVTPEPEPPQPTEPPPAEPTEPPPPEPTPTVEPTPPATPEPTPAPTQVPEAEPPAPPAEEPGQEDLIDD
ncbi:hypothetical protein [Cryobacterium sp. W22_MBD10_FK3]|uniref:hypothetical protein n=1 Tax=Cryobacterium sp. W22_MBD10_FK3 TaxID=3240273 RepID=UPI003F913501